MNQSITQPIIYIINSDGKAPPVICGVNTGQHMFVSASDQCNQIKVDIVTGTSTTRSWQIKVKQGKQIKKQFFCKNLNFYKKALPICSIFFYFKNLFIYLSIYLSIYLLIYCLTVFIFCFILVKVMIFFLSGGTPSKRLSTPGSSSLAAGDQVPWEFFTRRGIFLVPWET